MRCQFIDRHPNVTKISCLEGQLCFSMSGSVKIHAVL